MRQAETQVLHQSLMFAFTITQCRKMVWRPFARFTRFMPVVGKIFLFDYLDHNCLFLCVILSIQFRRFASWPQASPAPASFCQLLLQRRHECSGPVRVFWAHILKTVRRTGQTGAKGSFKGNGGLFLVPAENCHENEENYR